MRCYSPVHGSYGILWEVACSDKWDGVRVRFGAVEKVSIMTIAILVAISVVYSVVYGVKLWLKCRRDLVEEEQRQENLETARNLYGGNFFLHSKCDIFINLYLFPSQNETQSNGT